METWPCYRLSDVSDNQNLNSISSLSGTFQGAFKPSQWLVGTAQSVDLEGVIVVIIITLTLFSHPGLLSGLSISMRLQSWLSSLLSPPGEISPVAGGCKSQHTQPLTLSGESGKLLHRYLLYIAYIIYYITLVSEEDVSDYQIIPPQTPSPTIRTVNICDGPGLGRAGQGGPVRCDLLHVWGQHYKFSYKATGSALIDGTWRPDRHLNTMSSPTIILNNQIIRRLTTTRCTTEMQLEPEWWSDSTLVQSQSQCSVTYWLCLGAQRMFWLTPHCHGGCLVDV